MAMAMIAMTMMVTAFEREEPLEAPVSTITLRRTNSSSSFGGTVMLHLASKRGAIARQEPRGPGEDRDGQAAQGGRAAEGESESVMLAERADTERAGADAGVEGQHDRAEGAGAAVGIGV